MEVQPTSRVEIFEPTNPSPHNPLLPPPSGPTRKDPRQSKTGQRIWITIEPTLRKDRLEIEEYVEVQSQGGGGRGGYSLPSRKIPQGILWRSRLGLSTSSNLQWKAFLTAITWFAVLWVDWDPLDPIPYGSSTNPYSQDREGIFLSRSMAKKNELMRLSRRILQGVLRRAPQHRQVKAGTIEMAIPIAPSGEAANHSKVEQQPPSGTKKMSQINKLSLLPSLAFSTAHEMHILASRYFETSAAGLPAGPSPQYSGVQQAGLTQSILLANGADLFDQFSIPCFLVSVSIPQDSGNQQAAANHFTAANTLITGIYDGACRITPAAVNMDAIQGQCQEIFHHFVGEKSQQLQEQISEIHTLDEELVCALISEKILASEAAQLNTIRAMNVAPSPAHCFGQLLSPTYGSRESWKRHEGNPGQEGPSPSGGPLPEH
ncbi:hypothetical protein HYFRA_00003061 [Hymenoscyphus fraxineus]|uniref:Uncharacterized protein n=1 Tax=Hymenoscyphus fraxineus TaxID=746836 RepID=A0A9N9KP04_9HELO|nr:hypothetical protein HYFRA_00003061 [Hymenoscyphus fraxineus]